MKYSMKRQFAFIFITLITGTILLCLILNSTLLGKYYLNKKQNALVSAYYSINEASKAGDITSEEYDPGIGGRRGIRGCQVFHERSAVCS